MAPLCKGSSAEGGEGLSFATLPSLLYNTTSARFKTVYLQNLPQICLQSAKRTNITKVFCAFLRVDKSQEKRYNIID